MTMSLLPPLPVALPLAVAALLMAASPLLSRRMRDTLAIATTAAVAIICGLLMSRSLGGPEVYWFGGWQPRDGIAIGICFAIDPIGAGLALLAAVLVLAAQVYSCRYFKEIGSLYQALMLVFLGAMAGFCLTGDLFNMFVFFELMSVSAYALTGYKIEEEPALMGAYNFAITNSIGAFLVLAAIGLLYGRTGALNLAQLGRSLATGPVDGLVIAALTLVTCGFGVKAALVPFQFWLADAHAVAPSPVCVLFSGVMVELGLYAVARIYWTVFAATIGTHAAVVRDVWIGLGVLTALVGGIMCFCQRHLKRMLAFSTISHTGLFLIGVALVSVQGLAGAALYVVGHGLVKGALFLVTGILLNRFGSVDEGQLRAQLRGSGRKFWQLGVLFAIGGLALSGLPPFGTWLGKTVIEDGANDGGYGWLTGILLVSSALTGGAVLRATGRIFLDLGPPQGGSGTPSQEEKETEEDYDRPPMIFLAPTVALLALALAVGLWPSLERSTQRAAAAFQDTGDYWAAVLDNRAAVPPKNGASSHPGVISGLGAAAAALALAALALFRDRIPRAVRTLANEIGSPAIARLHALHSGQASDYVMWVTVGVVAMGGLLAWLF